ncbi:hypothetical protein AVBRAN9334_03120 [Campylobacter sp. RM9334]|uniref:type IV secretion system protein n=1 Tax=Campylobacter sp. RM9334 TaxID=2735732 RepID=UPI001DB5F1E3|nr:hypothetical protein [Campylobacter sp. RM9334]
MKKTLFKSLVVLLCFTNNAVASGIPTIDVAAIAQNIKSYIDDLKEYAVEANRWATTLMQYRQVVEHYAQELKNTTGISDIVSAINSAEGLYEETIKFKSNSLQLHSMVKEDLTSEGLKQRGKELSTKFLLSDYCSSYESKNKQAICYREVATTFQNEEELKEIDKNFNATLKEIESLAKKAVKATTMKESADAQTALQIAQSKLQTQEQQLKILNEKHIRAMQINEQLKEDERVNYNNNQYRNLKLARKFKLDDVRFE